MKRKRHSLSTDSRTIHTESDRLRRMLGLPRPWIKDVLHLESEQIKPISRNNPMLNNIANFFGRTPEKSNLQRFETLLFPENDSPFFSGRYVLGGGEDYQPLPSRFAHMSGRGEGGGTAEEEGGGKRIRRAVYGIALEPAEAIPYKEHKKDNKLRGEFIPYGYKSHPEGSESELRRVPQPPPKSPKAVITGEGDRFKEAYVGDQGIVSFRADEKEKGAPGTADTSRLPGGGHVIPTIATLSTSSIGGSPISPAAFPARYLSSRMEARFQPKGGPRKSLFEPPSDTPLPLLFSPRKPKPQPYAEEPKIPNIKSGPSREEIKSRRALIRQRKLRRALPPEHKPKPKRRKSDDLSPVPPQRFFGKKGGK